MSDILPSIDNWASTITLDTPGSLIKGERMYSWSIEGVTLPTKLCSKSRDQLTYPIGYLKKQSVISLMTEKLTHASL